MSQIEQSKQPSLELFINGKTISPDTNSSVDLLTFLRVDLGLRSAKQGCQDGICGSCLVLKLYRQDDQLKLHTIPACQMTLTELNGCHVLTYEAIASGFENKLGRVLDDHHATPCGFCRPGLAVALVAAEQTGDLHQEERLGPALCCHLCRCAGYAAWRRAVAEMRSLSEEDEQLKTTRHVPQHLYITPPERDLGITASANGTRVPLAITLADLAEAEASLYGWTALIAACLDWVPRSLHAALSLSRLLRHSVFGKLLRTAMLACGIHALEGEDHLLFPALDRPISFALERTYLATHLQDDLVLAIYTKRKGARLTHIAMSAGGGQVEPQIIARPSELIEETHLNPARRMNSVMALLEVLSQLDLNLPELPASGLLTNAAQRLFDQIDDSSSPWQEPELDMEL